MDPLDCYKEPGELLMLAEMATEMDRPEDVLKHLECLIKINPNLDQKTRDLFSTACKYQIDRKRHALHAIAWHTQDEDDEESSQDDPKKERRLSMESSTEYYDEVGRQLVQQCEYVIHILEDYLIPNAAENSNKVFYHKWLGDCFRYQTEYKHGDHSKCIEKAQEMYTAGMKLAEESLHASDYNRLGLALNYSVFLFEVYDNKECACEVAQKAFDEAEKDLASRQDAKSNGFPVMQLLQDNLTIWKNWGPDPLE